jgi:photosystem II stability/assembly factor-like uncharacterized protein
MITNACSGDKTKASALVSVRRFLPQVSCSCRLLLLLTLLSLPVSSQTGAWARQRLSTLAWLHSVFFLDQNRGWVVGSRGTMLATIDAGKSWQAKSSPTGDVLLDIYFTDEQNGWLLCETNVYELKKKDDPRTYLMQTSDGGAHWNQIKISGADINARLVRAVFRQGGHGWVFGEEGAIFTTRDSGESWTRLQAPTRHLLLGGVFIDEDRGWLVGAGSTIIQTSDGGETWHLSRLPISEQNAVRFAATSFVDNRLGWAVGSAGNIYRTMNGGRTWQQQNSGVTTDLFDVKFLDAAEGWAVGAEGTIIYTNDGGLHWATQPSDTEHPLERVFLADRTHGWAVGFGGTLVSYVRAEAPRIK